MEPSCFKLLTKTWCNFPKKQLRLLVWYLGFSQLTLLLLIWPSVQNLSIDTSCLLKSRKSWLMLYLPMAKDPGQTMVRRRKGCFFILCLSGHFTWIEILSLTMVLCQSPWPYHTLHSHHALENTSIPLSPFTHLIFTAAAWIFLLVTQRSKTDLGTKIRDSYHWEVSEWHVDDAGNREVKGKSFILLQWLSLKWRNNLPHSPFLPSNTTFQNLNCLSPVFNCLKITRAAFALKKTK